MGGVQVMFVFVCVCFPTCGGGTEMTVNSEWNIGPSGVIGISFSNVGFVDFLRNCVLG